jgi:hypothetical protein
VKSAGNLDLGVNSWTRNGKVVELPFAGVAAKEEKEPKLLIFCVAAKVYFWDTGKISLQIRPISAFRPYQCKGLLFSRYSDLQK